MLIVLVASSGAAAGGVVLVVVVYFSCFRKNGFVLICIAILSLFSPIIIGFV